MEVARVKDAGLRGRVLPYVSEVSGMGSRRWFPFLKLYPDMHNNTPYRV